MTDEQRQRVDSLLAELATAEPAFEGLGTPEPSESGAVGELVAMGPEIVPYLVARLAEAEARVAAHVALALGRSGDARAVEPLRSLRARFAAVSSKGPWDYAAIGQSAVALRRLGAGDADFS